MDIKEKIGSLNVIQTGSLMTSDELLAITMDNEYTISFSFCEDSTVKEQKIDIGTEQNGIVFKLYNFNNPLGSAIAKPIEFAKKNGKPIYISFCVYSIGTAKLLHYNLFC